MLGNLAIKCIYCIYTINAFMTATIRYYASPCEGSEIYFIHDSSTGMQSTFLSAAKYYYNDDDNDYKKNNNNDDI